MQFGGQHPDALGHSIGRFGQLRVLLQHMHQKCSLLGGDTLALFADLVQILAVLRVGHRGRFVAIGLPRLRQQD